MARTVLPELDERLLSVGTHTRAHVQGIRRLTYEPFFVVTWDTTYDYDINNNIKQHTIPTMSLLMRVIRTRGMQHCKSMVQNMKDVAVVDPYDTWERKKELGGGKSGATVLLVQNRLTLQYAVMKIYGEFGDNAHGMQRDVRELYTMCALSTVQGFPTVYTSGKMLVESKEHLFVISERMNGVSLSSLDLSKLDSQAMIIILLKILWLLFEAQKSFGNEFQHNDLHPDNIFVDVTDCKAQLITIGKYVFEVTCPAVSIIDFDLSRTDLYNTDVNPRKESKGSILPKAVLDWGGKVIGLQNLEAIVQTTMLQSMSEDIAIWNIYTFVFQLIIEAKSHVVQLTQAQVVEFLHKFHVCDSVVKCAGKNLFREMMVMGSSHALIFPRRNPKTYIFEKVAEEAKATKTQELRVRWLEIAKCSLGLQDVTLPTSVIRDLDDRYFSQYARHIMMDTIMARVDIMLKPGDHTIQHDVLKVSMRVDPGDAITLVAAMGVEPRTTGLFTIGPIILGVEWGGLVQVSALKLALVNQLLKIITVRFVQFEIITVGTTMTYKPVFRTTWKDLSPEYQTQAQQMSVNDMLNLAISRTTAQLEMIMEPDGVLSLLTTDSTLRSEPLHIDVSKILHNMRQTVADFLV